MAYMTDSEAKETIEDLHRTAVEDTANLERRIRDLKIEYVTDPWEGTAAQIDRLEIRLVVRRLQAEALAIALEKFEGVTVSARTHDVDAAWKFVVDCYDSQAYSPTRSEWTDKDIFEFAGEYHIHGLDEFKRAGK